MLENNDKELKAMGKMIDALESLDTDERQRVIGYVLRRFDLNIQTKDSSQTQNPHVSIKREGADVQNTSITSQDIRSLKEEKKPSSAIQMAVLVVYYLTEVASEGERVEAVGAQNIDEYFKQAGYSLPKATAALLVKTKNAGYLNSSERGLYKLNPVGYNLVAYNMPTKSSGKPRKKTKSTKKKTTNKKKS